MARSKAKSLSPLPSVELADGELPPIPNAAGYLIDKPVNLGQLMSEIGKATGTDVVNSCLVGDENGQTQLWLAPTSFDPAVLAQVVADHQPDPNWDVPGWAQDFHDVLAKLQADPTATLTDQDKDALMRGLALQFTVLLNLRGQS